MVALFRKTVILISGWRLNMKKSWISIILLIIAIGLGICSWFLLPEVVAVQVGMNGQLPVV